MTVFEVAAELAHIVAGPGGMSHDGTPIAMSLTMWR
jgi:hypothetical protein